MGLFDFFKKKNVQENEEVKQDNLNLEEHSSEEQTKDDAENLDTQSLDAQNLDANTKEETLEETDTTHSDDSADTFDTDNSTDTLDTLDTDEYIEENDYLENEPEDVITLEENNPILEKVIEKNKPTIKNIEIPVKNSIYVSECLDHNICDGNNICELEVQESDEEEIETVILSVDKNNKSKILTEEENKKETLFSKMKNGLSKTRTTLSSSLDNVFKAFTSISDDFYDELEETLILADFGAKTSMDIIETLRDKVKEKKIKDPADVKKLLVKIITDMLEQDEKPLVLEKPTVILIIGVNGVGKTTTIGKLASKFASEGNSVILAAGDTFRAAAIDQLQVWGDRSNIPVIRHEENTDSSAVIYDAIQSAKSKNNDILICDTAGRLHNKKNLMQELEKINRVINKEYPSAQLETFLVLDGTTGQNALQQAKQFNEVCDITGLVLTKLDGTAKGGVIVSIKNELNIPVRYVGVGEGIKDLQNFDPTMFAEALFED